MEEEQMRILKTLGVMALFASFALAGTASAAELSGKKIGIAAREITNDYNRDIIAGATEVLKAAGADVVVTDGGTDPRKHNENIENLINSHVAGIIVQLGDPQQLAAVIAKANAANIPVITTSVGSKTEGAIADVGGDESLMAAMLARSLLSSIDYKGKVIGFWVPGAPLLETRKRVFEAIVADYPNVKVQWVPTEHSAAKVQTQMEDLLTANPDKGSIAGVWGAYDLLVSGATEAVRRADRNEIKIASIDGDRIGFQMLLDENSPFVATIVQDVPAIGKLAAEALVSAVGGKKDFPSAIFTEVYIATHANGVKAAEKRWGAKIWDDLGIAKADVEGRWPQTSDLVVVRPILP
jgi:ABC-type sugar transport system substrate-binding protein